MESSWLLRIAKQLRQETVGPAECGREFASHYAQITKPTVLKDHRLSWTLDRISKAILRADVNLRLILNRKDVQLIEKSTLRHRSNGRGWWRKMPSEWINAAWHQYLAWPGDKFIANHKRIKAAVEKGNAGDFLAALGVQDCGATEDQVRRAMALYDPTRDDKGNPHQGRNGWEY